MTSSILSNAYWIVLAPLAAFVLILFFKRFLGGDGAWVGVLALLYGLVHSLMIAYGIFSGSAVLPSEGLQGHFFQWEIPWFTVGNYEFTLGLLLDGLSCVMLVVVTFISFLVQVYSLAYMKGHKRFGLYFAYVNLFTFSMLLLVVASNMVQFFVGWEGVGLCSYLLISFDYEREAAAYAGRKAFITTKIADLGFYLGLLMTFNYFGSFNIAALQQNVSTVFHPQWVLLTIPLLFFMGAMGKSAQVPFHVWLPDAMEGPTPASALIHAATMVAAGVYMVARVYFLFEAAPFSLEVVSWVGGITALFAATMGLVTSDIKRVLAFSTVSQLGFMMAALGCGGFTAGIFHLSTHAAFKALLFLCAGSVIHAVHTNDMWQMGGLMKKMPITAFTYLMATLAITGFPFFAGFYSKEEILSVALGKDPLLFAVLAFSALLTSFYMFRTWFLTFWGDPRDKAKFSRAHESPWLMTGPLLILAVLSVGLGFFMKYSDVLTRLLSWGEAERAPETGIGLVMVVSLSVFAIGLVSAFIIYTSKSKLYEKLGKGFGLTHLVLRQRYFVDEIYLIFIGAVYHPLAKFLARFDDDILDQGLVDGVARTGENFSWAGNLFDFRFIDQFLVDGNGTVLRRLSGYLRRLQSGLAQSYLFWMAVGLGLMIIWMAK